MGRGAVSICWLVAMLGVSPLAAGESAGVLAWTGAEHAIPIVRLTAEDGAIEIDGALDEPIWQSLPGHGDFRVIEPDTLARPEFETVIRLAYDERGLYIGAEMHQPPDTLIERLSGRDQRALNRDTVTVTLDTSGEGRYGNWFGIALGDSLLDGTVLPERQFASDWDGPWVGRSQRTDFGWTAEFFIPWGVVSMPSAGDVRQMGIFVSRVVAARDERYGWPALPDTVPQFMSALQRIEMRGVDPRQQYSIYPFAAVSQDWADDKLRTRLGAEVFWRPSSNFQLTGTLNPDFGNVESDDVVINLTATETFFPEKRLFFLEGQQIFFATPRADTRGTAVGQAGAPYAMVNTRRIGGKPRPPDDLEPGEQVTQRDRNRPVDLLGAVQLTGQVGQVRYGVLAAVEDDTGLDLAGTGRVRQDGSDYGIARVLWEHNPDGAYVGLGLLSTAVWHPQGDAIAHGLDWHYLTRNGRVKMDGQVMTSDVDGIGTGYGGFIDFEYSFRRGMSQRFGFEYFDEKFDINDLGFLQRNDHYRVRSSFQLSSPNLTWARNNEFDLRGFLQQSVSEDRFNDGGVFVSNRLTMNNLSRLTTRANYFFRAFDDLNSFGNGIFRRKGRADLSAQWDSDPTRSLSWGVGAGWAQEDLGGDNAFAEGRVTWRPTDRFNLALSLLYRDRDGWLLHQRDDVMATFDARQWQPRASVEYFLSARQQFRVSLQWVAIRAREQDFFRIPDEPGSLVAIDRDEATGLPPSSDFSVSQYAFQVRYRWEFAPLSDVFVVYTRQADRRALLGEDSFSNLASSAWRDPLEDLLVVKVRYRMGS